MIFPQKPPETLKNDENTLGTMKNEAGTLKHHKNRPGIIKNQPGTLKNHKKHSGTKKINLEP